MRLPAFDHLAEQISEELRVGRIAVLRGQPFSGRSTVVEAVVHRLRDSGPVFEVSGTATASTLSGTAHSFEETLEAGAPAVVTVDDFGAALATSHGVAFQNRLTAAAVDGEHAENAGLLLIARQNETLTRFAVAGAGSPVAGAAQVNAYMPLLSEGELVTALVQDGCTPPEASELVSRFGAHLRLIDLARTRTGREATDHEIEDAIIRAVAELTGATAGRMLEFARRPDRSLAESLADQFLAPIVYQPEPGRTKLSPALAQRAIADLLVDGTTSWPSDLAASVRRFRARLHGLRPALWVDRYHGAYLSQLSRFLDSLSNCDCDVDLLMLGTETGVDTLPGPVRRRFEQRLRPWAEAGLRIEWRLADAQDYNLLHQRMLLAPNLVGGYVLPPNDRITGAHLGTDSDAILDPAPVSLVARAWARATLFARH